VSERRKQKKKKKKNFKTFNFRDSLDAVLQHVPDRVAVPAARGVEELGCALLSLVGGGVHGQEVVDHRPRADADRLVERRRAPTVGDADVGAGLDERLDRREDVFGRGDVQGGPVVVVPGVGAGSGLEQPADFF
jgi:hypothetical protein